MAAERHYAYTIAGRKFFVVRCRVRNFFYAWEGRGNPMLWFAWEKLASGENDYFACGVKTMREAKQAIKDVVARDYPDRRDGSRRPLLVGDLGKWVEE